MWSRSRARRSPAEGTVRGPSSSAGWAQPGCPTGMTPVLPCSSPQHVLSLSWLSPVSRRRSGWDSGDGTAGMGQRGSRARGSSGEPPVHAVSAPGARTARTAGPGSAHMVKAAHLAGEGCQPRPAPRCLPRSQKVYFRPGRAGRGGSGGEAALGPGGCSRAAPRGRSRAPEVGGAGSGGLSIAPGAAGGPGGGPASPSAVLAPAQPARSLPLPPGGTRPLSRPPRSSGGRRAEPQRCEGGHRAPPALPQLRPPNPHCYTSNPHWATFGIFLGAHSGCWGPQHKVFLVLQKLEGCNPPVLLPHTCPMQPHCAACCVCPAPGGKKGSAAVPASAAERGAPGPPAGPQGHSGSGCCGAGKPLSTTLNGEGELGVHVLLPPHCPKPSSLPSVSSEPSSPSGMHFGMFSLAVPRLLQPLSLNL